MTERQTAAESYAALAQDGNSSQKDLAAAAQKVKELGAELAAAISEGAEVCQQCQAPPLGMVKTPAYENAGVEVPAVFEVGCIHCPPYLVPDELRGAEIVIDGVKQKVARRSYSARANTPADAVARWNAGQFVQDTLIDRIPGLVVQAAPAPADEPASE